VHFVTDKQGFPDMAGQLQRGQCDAVFLAEPYASKAEEEYGQVELADLDQGATMNFPIGGYVATQAWARQHRQTAAAFVRAIEEGQAFAEDNPSAARAALGKADQLSPEVTAVMSLPDFPVGPVNEQRMQRTADAMLQFGILTPQYATEVRSGTLVRSMIAPDQPPPRPQATPTRS
jgi:NitT/TauT family transport system substrate-binding protein